MELCCLVFCSGRNCGYAKYNSAAFAASAAAALNMMEVSDGVIAKVAIEGLKASLCLQTRGSKLLFFRLLTWELS